MIVFIFKIVVLVNAIGLCRCQWTHAITLDPLNKYHLRWFTDDVKQQITFKVIVQTRGWLGFGLSNNGGMSGSDLVIGWIDNNGITHFHDRFAEEEDLPTIDDSQDWHLLSSGQNDSHTWFEFTRAYHTCDMDTDLQITSDITKLIWAYNDDKPSSDNAMPQHRSHNRGTRSVHLLSLAEHEFSNTKKENIEKWDITSSNLLIPDETDTTYWCKIVIAPFKHKVHVVRIEPIISPANAPFVHHMVLYRCLHPNISHMEQYASHSGANCVDMANMPYDFIHCQSVYMVWATGGGAFNMPKDVGMPIAEDQETTYFLFEIHYDNPELLGGKYDSSGLRLFYTRQLRPFDADTATMGSVVDYRLLIPPKQEAVTVAGHCHPECFRHKMPRTGLNIIASLPHAHKHAKKILVRHFRNGTELQPIAEEKNYDFNFQDFRRSSEGSVIMPDDQITVECTYDTRNRRRPLFGGLSTQEEMCLVFVIYYPRMKATRSCLSGLTPQTVMTLSDVAAVKNTEDNDMDPLVVIPTNYANERLSSYVQNKSYWDPDVMTASQQLIRFAPQKAQCYWRKVEGMDDIKEINDLIEYPKVVTPFKVPTKQCQTLSLSLNSCFDSKPFPLLIVISFIVFII